MPRTICPGSSASRRVPTPWRWLNPRAASATPKAFPTPARRFPHQFLDWLASLFSRTASSILKVGLDRGGGTAFAVSGEWRFKRERSCAPPLRVRVADKKPSHGSGKKWSRFSFYALGLFFRRKYFYLVLQPARERGLGGVTPVWHPSLAPEARCARLRTEPRHRTAGSFWDTSRRPRACAWERGNTRQEP